MIKSNSTARTVAARRRAFAFSLSALVIAFAFVASLVASPAASDAQTQSGESKPVQVKLGVKQGDSRTELKFVSERGELTKATATDPAGTRSLKRIDKLTIPCKEADMVCKTVETEGGILVGVCYCPDTQTALLLPAIQSAREAARRSTSTNTNTNTNSNIGGSLTKPGTGTLTLSSGNNAAGVAHVKVFSGVTGAELTQKCWGDERLKLIVCQQ